MNESPVIVTLVLGFLGVIFSVLNQNNRFSDLKEAINQRFDQMEKRFEQIDRRFEQIDRRFDQIDVRLERIENKLDNHEIRITRIEEPLIRR